MSGFPIWPIPQRPTAGAWIATAQDGRAVFQPDYGPPITRRRQTTTVHFYNAVTWEGLDDDERAAFIAWYDGDLAGGSLPFGMRDPITGDWARWKVAGEGESAYSLGYAGGCQPHSLTLSLVKLPGPTWWAPYMVEDADEVPALVLDYAAGVFGTDGRQMARADLLSNETANGATVNSGRWPAGLMLATGTMLAAGVYNGPAASRRIASATDGTDYLAIRQTETPQLGITCNAASAISMGAITGSAAFALAVATDGVNLRAVRGGGAPATSALSRAPVVTRLEMDYRGVTLGRVVIWRRALPNAVLQAITT